MGSVVLMPHDLPWDEGEETQYRILPNNAFAATREIKELFQERCMAIMYADTRGETQQEIQAAYRNLGNIPFQAGCMSNIRL